MSPVARRGKDLVTSIHAEANDDVADGTACFEDGAADEAARDDEGTGRARGGRALSFVRRLPVFVLVGLIRGYQRFISPLTGPTCKYYPSCSAYALTAVRRHGALRGTGLALWRLLRCNPWSLGGVDDVPPARHHH